MRNSSVDSDTPNGGSLTYESIDQQAHPPGPQQVVVDHDNLTMTTEEPGAIDNSSGSITSGSFSWKVCLGSTSAANLLVMPGILLAILGFAWMLLSQRWTTKNDKLQDCINLRQIDIASEACDEIIQSGIPSFWRKRGYELWRREKYLNLASDTYLPSAIGFAPTVALAVILSCLAFYLVVLKLHWPRSFLARTRRAQNAIASNTFRTAIGTGTVLEAPTFPTEEAATLPGWRQAVDPSATTAQGTDSTAAAANGSATSWDALDSDWKRTTSPDLEAATPSSGFDPARMRSSASRPQTAKASNQDFKVTDLAETKNQGRTLSKIEQKRPSGREILSEVEASPDYWLSPARVQPRGPEVKSPKPLTHSGHINVNDESRPTDHSKGVRFSNGASAVVVPPQQLPPLNDVPGHRKGNMYSSLKHKLERSGLRKRAITRQSDLPAEPDQSQG